MSPILHNLHINGAFLTPGAYLPLFADETGIYPTDRKERYVIRKLQGGLSSMESWDGRWNVKINADRIQAIYFFRGNGPAESHLTLKGRNIPFTNQVKYPDVIFDGKVTSRYHKTMIEIKTFRTFITVYSLFQNERLGANIKLTFHTAIIISVKTYAL
jgi:hypothetical protein